MHRLLPILALLAPATTIAQERQTAARNRLAEIAVFSLVLDQLRHESASGRVIFDRLILDTARRLAPPALALREHHEPEVWAKRLGAQVVTGPPGEYAGVWPLCDDASGYAAVAFGEPSFRGDTATLVTRFREARPGFGCRVRTIVEVFTVARKNAEWSIVGRRTRSLS
jgi:hypothetical protein